MVYKAHNDSPDQGEPQQPEQLDALIGEIVSSSASTTDQPFDRRQLTVLIELDSRGGPC